MIFLGIEPRELHMSQLREEMETIEFLLKLITEGKEIKAQRIRYNPSGDPDSIWFNYRDITLKDRLKFVLRRYMELEFEIQKRGEDANANLTLFQPINGPWADYWATKEDREISINILEQRGYDI